MSGVWRKTLVYLGLVEEPEAHDELPEQFTGGEPDRPREREPTPRQRRPVRAVDGPRDTAAADEDTVRPLRFPAEEGREPGRDVRVAVLDVRSFDQCEDIGATYRAGAPVVFDLGRADAGVARRVLDFVSGVTFALQGSLTKVGSRAFLLVPDGVAVPDGERRRLRELGYRVGS